MKKGELKITIYNLFSTRKFHLFIIEKNILITSRKIKGIFLKIKDIFPKTKGIFLKIRFIFWNIFNMLIIREF